MAKVREVAHRARQLPGRNPEREAGPPPLRAADAGVAARDVRADHEAAVVADHVQHAVGGVAEVVGRGRQLEVDVLGDLALRHAASSAPTAARALSAPGRCCREAAPLSRSRGPWGSPDPRLVPGWTATGRPCPASPLGQWSAGPSRRLRTPLCETPIAIATTNTLAAPSAGSRRRAPLLARRPGGARDPSAQAPEAIRRARREPGRGQHVEPGVGLGVRLGTLGAQLDSEPSEVLEVGVDRLARRARGRSPRARARPRDPAASRAQRSLIAGPPQLLDHSVQPGAGVRLRDPDHRGDLGVGEPGEELERHQLALPRRQLGDRGAERRSAERHLGALLGADRRLVDGLGGQRGLAPRAVAARRAPRCGRSRTARRAAFPASG